MSADMPVFALTLWQPWASLCVVRLQRDCDCLVPWLDGAGQHSPGCSCFKPGPIVKTLETRGRRPPAKLVGQRILIHAAKRTPEWGEIGAYRVERWYDEVHHVEDCNCDYEGGVTTECGRGGKYHMSLTCNEQLVSHLPLGAIVGSAVLGEPLPIIAAVGRVPNAPCIERVTSTYLREWYVAGPVTSTDPLHWHPEGDLLHRDVSDQSPYGDFTPGRWAWPLHDAAPTTERCPSCWGDGDFCRGDDMWPTKCRVCGGTGRCDPIPAKGRQQIGWPCDLADTRLRWGTPV